MSTISTNNDGHITSIFIDNNYIGFVKDSKFKSKSKDVRLTSDELRAIANIIDYHVNNHASKLG